MPSQRIASDATRVAPDPPRARGKCPCNGCDLPGRLHHCVYWRHHQQLSGRYAVRATHAFDGMLQFQRCRAAACPASTAALHVRSMCFTNFTLKPLRKCHSSHAHKPAIRRAAEAHTVDVVVRPASRRNRAGSAHVALHLCRLKSRPDWGRTDDVDVIQWTASPTPDPSRLSGTPADRGVPQTPPRMIGSLCPPVGAVSRISPHP